VICDFGDVIIVPFPFVERPINKRRPALVLTSEAFNDSNGQSVLLMITTGAGSTWPSDIEIGDRRSAGLLHRCLIRWKAFTLPNDAIVQRIGQLSEPDLEAVRRSARNWLAPSGEAVPN